MGKRIAILLALILGSVGCAKEIPLSETWALRMPGTKNVQELEPEHYGKSQQGLAEEQQLEHLTQSFSHQIPQLINEKAKSKPIGEGFVVIGTGKQALEDIKKALDTTPPTTLPANEELTLFFYSRLYGSYVHLKHVARSDKTVTIEFAFVTHRTKDMTNHFALIPLGKLSPGNYEVKITPSSNKRLSGKGWTLESAAKDFVCQPFRFLVRNSDELEEKKITGVRTIN